MRDIENFLCISPEIDSNGLGNFFKFYMIYIYIKIIFFPAEMYQLMMSSAHSARRISIESTDNAKQNWNKNIFL